MKSSNKGLAFFLVFLLMFMFVCPLPVQAAEHAVSILCRDDGVTAETSLDSMSDETELTVTFTLSEGNSVSSILIRGQTVAVDQTEAQSIHGNNSDFSCTASYDSTNQELSITNIVFDYDSQALEVEVYSSSSGGLQNPSGGNETPTALYLTWNSGSQTITFDETNNPNHVFTVSTSCDFATLSVYAVPEGEQIVNTNNLELNSTNNANRISTHIRSFHVTDYWRAPNLTDDDPNNDHPITSTGVNCSITIIKEDADAIAIDIQNRVNADAWEFGNLALGDLTDAISSSTAVNLEVYYQNTSIDFSSCAGATYSSIEAIDVPEGAITITGNNIVFNSAFYDNVTFKITLNTGEIRYVKIIRKGIAIRAYTTSDSETLHGTQPGCPISWSDGSNCKIIATFYYPDTRSCTDYQIIANLEYANGNRETKIISGTSGLETNCVGGATKGGDYVIWSGNNANRPISVSVTAVSTGDFSGDATNFSGASFGSGAGVTWTAQGE